ncbi:MAG: S1 RNA-binding domain-containing protein [Candidatus Heteroscillospira sp.]|jgi:S1 RNA binding domain protein
MQLEVGAILEGKVTGITKFGAFVALPEGKSGLVHISEIANTYVSEVRDYVQDGQAVKVKVIGISPDGKINLSIKKAEERPRPAANPTPRPSAPRGGYVRQEEKSPEASFEDKLKQFMQESDSRMSGNKLYDRRSSTRRRRD